MPDNLITDEGIESLVSMVQTAEVMAKTMDMTVSDAVRTMLKTAQIMQTLSAKASDTKLAEMMLATKKPQ